MIELNEPYILATAQKILFNRVTIQKVGDSISAVVSFDVANQDGKQIDHKTYIYTGENFNIFWANFNSGKFLYEELVAKEELQIEVPETVETDFVNPVE